MRRLLLALPFALVLTTSHAWGQAKTDGGSRASANSALATMKARAEEVKIPGVAVVAYFEGDSGVEFKNAGRRPLQG
jgi:hypothetical protein